MAGPRIDSKGWIVSKWVQTTVNRGKREFDFPTKISSTAAKQLYIYIFSCKRIWHKRNYRRIAFSDIERSDKNDSYIIIMIITE